ncbi:lycopene cyclase domain-containing protein [Pseudactinotalea sp. HY158]|uniref:lycopene cyclase domain-containing protein n=1 Tax=Pseudactinotalea sp. HY158 TaxID=2654547 RepID=UPI00129CCA91|nr:lycopene cyclase domain-containing protein [Pseudactinotalea sp. HY158]QGH70201.1 lycopene cyclase domain-containing protein [Pseudactinotalea sp. HY158]
MPEYTVFTAIGIVLVLGFELVWARTGIFRRGAYWLAMAIVFGFQVAVDGWLTKLSNPIVLYNPDEFLGIRLPWDIPIEDFGFGFAMLTLTLILWIRSGQSKEQE